MSWKRGHPTGRCRVCGHPDRVRIELLLASGAGQKSVGDKFGLSKDSVFRHWHGHVSQERRAALLLGPAQVQALAAKVAEESESVLDHHKAVRAGLYAGFVAALEAGDRNSIGLLGGRLKDLNDSIAKMTGQLASSPLVVNNSLTLIMESPQVQQLFDEVVQVLAPSPRHCRHSSDTSNVGSRPQNGRLSSISRRWPHE